ncbi:MAG: hypothetical protein BJ554DRAFT_3409, partial [Olpidium bornovanus]
MGRCTPAHMPGKGLKSAVVATFAIVITVPSRKRTSAACGAPGGSEKAKTATGFGYATHAARSSASSIALISSARDLNNFSDFPEAQARVHSTYLGKRLNVNDGAGRRCRLDFDVPLHLELRPPLLPPGGGEIIGWAFLPLTGGRNATAAALACSSSSASAAGGHCLPKGSERAALSQSRDRPTAGTPPSSRLTGADDHDNGDRERRKTTNDDEATRCAVRPSRGELPAGRRRGLPVFSLPVIRLQPALPRAVRRGLDSKCTTHTADPTPSVVGYNGAAGTHQQRQRTKMGPCADAPSGRDQAPKWELPAHLASRMHLCEIMAWIARGRPVIGAARDMEKGTPVGDAHRAKNKVPALEGARTQRSKVFKRPFFPLPTGQGEVILNAQSEFSLSKTLLQEVASSKLRSIPSPDPYHKIRTNIFVERRPRKSGEAPVCDCVPPANGGPGCAENCLNRLLLYECPAKLCPCGEQCTNQRLQRRERVTHLEVFWTGARGHGLRTLVPIRAGALVVEYCGEVISQQEMQRRADTVYRGKKNLYFLQYGPGEILDAGVKGTEARFLNHSCDPNCHIEKWWGAQTFPGSGLNCL